MVDDKTARLLVDKQQVELRLGEWSEIVELRFKAGMLFNIHAITRFIATSLSGVIRFMPCHCRSILSIPHGITHLRASFSKKLWKDVGPYLTLGWPQDTTGLEEGCISDEQFLDLVSE